MTLAQRQKEWNVCFQTRIGNLCGNAAPTNEQKQIAHQEADAHIEALELEEWKQHEISNH